MEDLRIKSLRKVLKMDMKEVLQSVNTMVENDTKIMISRVRTKKQEHHRYYDYSRAIKIKYGSRQHLFIRT